MKGALILILLVNIYNVAAQADNFPCSQSGVYFRPGERENQCHEFIMCANGVRFNMTCGHNMLFDRDSLQCVQFNQVNCDIDTCQDTWNGRDFMLAIAPNLKSCSEYFLCAFGTR